MIEFMKKLIVLLMAAAMTLQGAKAAKKAAWAPAGDNIKTRWAAEVKAENPLPEYPRPQMARDYPRRFRG